MTSLKILHISDIHVSKAARWDSDEVLAKASQQILELCNSSQRPDYIAITGDLANFGLEAEYEIVEEWLDQTFLGTGSAGYSAESLLIVPGNHDVERGLISNTARAMQTELCERGDQERVASVLQDEHDRATMMRRFQSYLAFLTRLYGADVSEPWWRRTITHSGKTIQFDGLCSSWMCSKSQEKGNLLIGRYQFTTLPNPNVRPDISIAFVHHPTDYLLDFDAEHTISRYEEHYDMVLRGHLHSQSAVTRINIDKGYVELASGALYAGSAFPNAFQIIEIIPDELRARVRFYVWNNHRWIPDRNAYQSAVDGVAEIPFFGGASEADTKNTEPRVVSSQHMIEPNSELDFGYQSDNAFLDALPRPETALKHLANVPQYKVTTESQHLAVRQAIRAEAEAHLRKSRVVWISADWGTGRRPFVGSLIERLTTRESRAPVYHLNCDEADTAEQILDCVTRQFGLPLQKFCQWVNAIKQSFVVVEDVHSSATDMGVGGPSVTFRRIIETTLEYCPNLSIIVVARMRPPAEMPVQFVELSVLDELEIRDYLGSHAKYRVEIDKVETLDRIALATGGLPRNLDLLADRLQVASLDDALQSIAPAGLPDGAVSADLPRSLIGQIERLRDSSDDGSKRSYRLLQALSILEAGAPLQTIKRLYPSSPFWEPHAKTLLELSMIDVIPIAPESNSFSDTANSSLEAQKLLRVPRAIREFVQRQISDEEFHSILHAAASTFFGNNWRSGTIKLLKKESVSGHENGLGNVHVLCMHLIRHALQAANKSELETCLAVAVNYSSSLYHAERYRDGYIAAHEMLAVLQAVEHDSEPVDSRKTDLKIIAARCARMIGKSQEAVDVLPEVIRSVNKSVAMDLSLTLALAQQSVGAIEEAITTAQHVCDNTPTDDYRHMQAKTILLEYEKSGDELDKSLQRIETRARKRGHTTVADNITLSRVSSCETTTKVIEYTTKVITGDGSDYNKLRARIKRVVALLDAGQGNGVSDSDRKWIEQGYSYLFGQRMNSLFDDCHKTLWRIYSLSDDRAKQLRLFRHSSFLWRLRGEDQKELACATELNKVDFSKIEELKACKMTTELRYFLHRIGTLIISMPSPLGKK